MILVAIGSNLNSKSFGSPEQNCNAAIEILRKYFEVTQSSSFYKTEPIPKSEQPWFVNCIVNIKSKISPSRILDTLLEIELQFGRKRNRKNEARVIDLDLIAYNNLIVKSLKLTLPHPRMHLRKFVIQPICDINKNWIHPISKKKAFEILKELANQKISNIN
tara:strand:- start:308 stop:793 length:486 start_codon:yes stop_codon:yes gene_type:complete